MELYNRINSPKSIQHISYKTYQVESYLGCGVTSEVFSVRSSSSGKIYACKSIDTAQVTLNSLLREVILGRLFQHQNILKIHKILMLDEFGNMDRLNVLYDFMNSDLRVFIHNSIIINEYVSYYKGIMNQILQGMHYLHSVGVIHRDLKPDNILLDNNFNVKIADFGLSCLTTEKIDYSREVVTLLYRSPELFMNQEYDESIDMWSVGCIFAEMLMGEPLIFINERIGWQFDNLYKRIETKLYGVDPALVDLILKMLEFDPIKRISAFQALNHPFFTNDIYREYLPLNGCNKIKLYSEIDSLSEEECFYEIKKEIAFYINK